MVFSHGVGRFFETIFESLSFSLIFRVILSLAVGLYLFGLLYSYLAVPVLKGREYGEKRGDLLVINIFFSCLLIVYTIFVAIQFRYLFAGADLPYGITYTEYARKGFFELLALSGVNIALILFAVRRAGGQSGAGSVTRGLCCYLCLVTFVLLASSFYRMGLYCGSDGLTRLRFFVLGFLIFEAFGLALTLVYIFKPKFNIVMCYLAIGLVYYMLLNLVPVDYFVAKNQVDMYLAGQRTEVYYALSLSSDAAPQIARLKETEVGGTELLDMYFRSWDKPRNWRRYNLSQKRAERIYGSLWE
ncbi:MAG: DUF4153 domain-containing protein, partial [Clostridia bacterium]